MTDKNEMSALELPNADHHGNGSGGQNGYKVEVRTSYYYPIVLNDLVIDGVWRPLLIKKGVTPWGIKIPIATSRLESNMADQGLLPYEAAQALRWAFLALLVAQHVAGARCVQTRLVKVKYSYTYATEEIGVSECQEGILFKSDVGCFTPRFPTETMTTSD